MASINYTLLNKENEFKEREISLIVYINPKQKFQVGSMISLNKSNWNARTHKITIPPIPGLVRDEILAKEELLTTLTKALLDEITFAEDKNVISRTWAKEFIKHFHIQTKKKRSEKNTIEVNKTIPDYMELYLKEKNFSESRVKHFRGMIRSVKRFQLYQMEEKLKNPILYLDSLDNETLDRMRKFLGMEHDVYNKYPWIYDQVPYMVRDAEKNTKLRKTPVKAGKVNKRSIPENRGINMVLDIMIRFRTFFYWARDAGYTTNNPFKHYDIEEPLYIDPIYPDLTELKMLFMTDMSYDKNLEIARDTYILQANIGCRVSDLYRMTNGNVIRGAIEYIPSKNRKRTLKTVRVPLSNMAMQILVKYRDPDRESILPFIPKQDYNTYIKVAFRKAGLTYNVTIVDQKTHETIFVPICDVVSSHMARRTFVGNLTKASKQDSVVKELGGFTPNSRAICRYRKIDDEMKMDVISVFNKVL